MFSFEPSEEQRMLIDVARRFADSELRPAARDADEAGALPDGLVSKGWELGIVQASIPEAYGGFGGRSALTSVLALEELARGDMAGALALMGPGLFALPVLVAGTEEQRRRWLPPVVQGEWRPYTSAWIEGAFDFDPSAPATTAEATADGYALSGEKRFVPFAPEAEAMLVFAALEGRAGVFVVPRDTEGLSVGKREEMLGLHALPCHRVRLDRARVPRENRLGEEPGNPGVARVLDAARVAISAAALGLARGTLEYAIEYAKEREVFGMKVAQKQSIAFFLAEMGAEIEAARLLAWEAAWMLDRDASGASKGAYLAQAAAADMAMTVTDRGVQILGGYGYIRDYPVELWYRNGRAIAALTGLAMV